MRIITAEINGITEVDFDPDKKEPYFYKSEKFIWIKNKSPSAMYASAENDFNIGGDGVLEIPAGECAMINTPETNIIYISGDGDAGIYTSDVPQCPWSGGGSSGGGTPAGSVDYTSQVSGKPGINGVTVSGNKSFEDYGLIPVTSEELQAMWE